jgi:hypothetical protein
MQARAPSLHTTPLVWDFEIHRLLHALSASGHFTKQAASPCRSRSESAPSWALASVVIVGAAIESTDKITAILRKSNIAALPCSLQMQPGHEKAREGREKLLSARSHQRLPSGIMRHVDRIVLKVNGPF